jgi:hypothetical protein
MKLHDEYVYNAVGHSDSATHCHHDSLLATQVLGFSGHKPLNVP